MIPMDDFRFLTRKLLLELDAATTQTMMLVSAEQTTGPDWDCTTDRLRKAYADWNSLLNIPIANADLYSDPVLIQ